jgi:hypothetical protein
LDDHQRSALGVAATVDIDRPRSTMDGDTRTGGEKGSAAAAPPHPRRLAAGATPRKE